MVTGARAARGFGDHGDVSIEPFCGPLTGGFDQIIEVRKDGKTFVVEGPPDGDGDTKGAGGCGFTKAAEGAVDAGRENEASWPKECVIRMGTAGRLPNQRRCPLRRADGG